MPLRTAASVLLLAALPATHAAQAARPYSLPLEEVAAQPTSSLRGLLDWYAADRAALERSAAAAWSPSHREHMRGFYTTWREGLERVRFDGLARGERIDWILFANRLDYELRELDIASARDVELAPLVPFAAVVDGIATTRRSMERVDPEATADTYDALADTVDEAREALGDDGPGPVLARRAARRVDGIRGTLAGVHRFYDGYDPLYSWWTRAPYERADEALAAYGRALRERGEAGSDDAEGIRGEPIGRDALLSELAREMIAYSPEELVAIAEEEFAWCEREMRRAADDLGLPGWSAALEYVKGLHPEPGEQPALVRALAVEAIDYLREHDLVTIPALAEDVWRMDMMPPSAQAYTPFFTGGEVVRVAFPTDDMEHGAKRMSLRSNNEHFSRAVVHHELIPGHHLQGFLSRRYRPWRAPFRTPFYGEGWALYWELFLWDRGFQRSAEDRVGMLFWRAHRAARIVCSLGYHLEQMQPAEMIDYLVERVGHERSAAEAEVRRWVQGGYGPLYQAAYLTGGLQLYALRRELVGGGGMAERAFHDAVLHQNSIPIELVRAALDEQVELTKEFKARWRFRD